MIPLPRFLRARCGLLRSVSESEASVSMHGSGRSGRSVRIVRFLLGLETKDFVCPELGFLPGVGAGGLIPSGLDLVPGDGTRSPSHPDL